MVLEPIVSLWWKLSFILTTKFSKLSVCVWKNINGLSKNLIPLPRKLNPLIMVVAYTYTHIN